MRVLIFALALACLAFAVVQDEKVNKQEIKLWQIPGLRRAYPHSANMTNFRSLLNKRGFQSRSNARGREDRIRSLGSIAALHTPYSENFQSTALYAHAGFISLNYSATYDNRTVHLDEFVSLFEETNATWDCNISETPNSFESTLTFSPNSTNGESLDTIVSYLYARLASPRAMGPEILTLHETRPLWSESCTLRVLNLTSEPYYAVSHAEMLEKMQRDGTNATVLRFRLTHINPLHLFAHIKHNLQWDPNVERARSKYPWLNIELRNDTRQGGGNRTRRPRMLPIDPVFTRSTDSLQQYDWSLAGFNFNYGGSRGVAARDLIPLLADVPASTLGCRTCYAYFDLSLYASLDYCNPVSLFSSCWVNGHGYVYLRELGAYLEGTADVRGEVQFNGPMTFRTSTRISLLPRIVMPLISFTVAGLPIIVRPAFEVDAEVRLDGTLEGNFRYGGSYYQQASIGAIYNVIRRPSNPMFPIALFGSPQVNLPTPSFGGITAASATLTFNLQPRLTLLLYGSVPIYSMLDTFFILSGAWPAPSPRCSGGANEISLMATLHANAVNGMSDITWDDILDYDGLDWLTSSYATGVIAEGWQLNPIPILSTRTLLDRCIQIVQPSASVSALPASASRTASPPPPIMLPGPADMCVAHLRRSIGLAYVGLYIDVHTNPENSVYGNYWNCEFSVSVPAGLAIRVSFLRLSTERGYDIFRIQSATQHFTASGTTTPDSITIADPSVSLSFSSDGSVGGSGVKVRVEAIATVSIPSNTPSRTPLPIPSPSPTALFDNSGMVDICAASGRALELQSAWTVFTTNTQTSYPMNAMCTFNVSAGPGYELRFQFKRFQTESGYDYFRIVNSDTQAVILSPQSGSINLDSSSLATTNAPASTSATLIFTSDSLVSFAGVQVNVSRRMITVVTYAGINMCGTTQTTVNLAAGQSMQVTTNSASTYGNSVVCMLTFRGAAGTYMQIHFKQFNTERNFDYFAIRDADTNTALLSPTSGATLPANITATASTGVTVTFSSDSSVTFSGVQFIVRAVAITSSGGDTTVTYDMCNTVNGLDITLSDVRPQIRVVTNANTTYNNMQSCRLTVSAPSGYKLRVEFEQFATERSFDWFSIYNGVGASLLPPTSGGNAPSNFTTPDGTDAILLTFTSDGSVVLSGVRVRVMMLANSGAVSATPSPQHNSGGISSSTPSSSGTPPAPSNEPTPSNSPHHGSDNTPAATTTAPVMQTRQVRVTATWTSNITLTGLPAALCTASGATALKTTWLQLISAALSVEMSQLSGSFTYTSSRVTLQVSGQVSLTTTLLVPFSFTDEDSVQQYVYTATANARSFVAAGAASAAAAVEALTQLAGTLSGLAHAGNAHLTSVHSSDSVNLSGVSLSAQTGSSGSTVAESAWLVPTPSDSSNSSSNTAVIAGVVGALAGAVIAAAVMVAVYKMRVKKPLKTLSLQLATSSQAAAPKINTHEPSPFAIANPYFKTAATTQLEAAPKPRIAPVPTPIRKGTEV